MSEHQEQDAEYRNHLRLLASEIIVKLYKAGDVSQLTLVKVAVDRALELLGEVPSCEHGVREGDWCEVCNMAYKEAALDEQPVAYDDGTVGTE